MSWFTSAIIAVLVLSSYNFFLKVSSSKISSLYALPFIALGVFLTSLIGLITSKILPVANLTYSKQGALYSILAGVLWGLGGIFFFWMFSKNAPLSVGVPLVTGGLTIVASILGILILKEPISAFKLIGIMTIVLGFLFLSRA